MNKNLVLLLLLLILGGAGYYLTQKNKGKTGSSVAWDMDFTIPDTAAINKIFIADRKGNQITLERGKEHWMVNQKYMARPTAVNLLLDGFTKQRVRYIPTESSKPDMIATLGSQGIKVEVYQGDAKPAKVFYVGGVTPDELGTHMIMEGSEQPYVVHIPSFVGQIRTRYLVSLDDWKDRYLFREDPKQIQSISLEYPLQKKESFILEKTGASFQVKPFYATQQVSAAPQRKGIAEAYAIQYEGLGAEAFENLNTQRDSVTSLIPFVILTLTKTDGSQKQVKFWSTEVEKNRDTGAPFVFRYYADCSWGDFMLVQHTVFGPIFRGYDYFFEGSSQNTSRLKQ